MIILWGITLCLAVGGSSGFVGYLMGANETIGRPGISVLFFLPGLVASDF